MKARKQRTWGDSPFCLFRTTIFLAFHSIDCSQFLFLHAFLFSFPPFIFVRYSILSHVMHLATITLILVTLQKETNHDLAENKQNGSTTVI